MLKIPYSFRPVRKLISISVCERSAWLLGIVMSVQVSRFAAQFCKNTERFNFKAIQY